MVAFPAGRRRPAQQQGVHDAELARRAGAALVAADERIHGTADELGFAEAQLGPQSITQATEALDAARRHLGDAFRLHRLNHEAIPGAADEIRARYERILQLCDSIDRELDEQLGVLAERIALARRAPELIAGLCADAERLRARLPRARATIERLAARYAPDALADVEADVADAAQLLAFAEHSLGVAERSREGGQRDQVALALEASAESMSRAATLLDAVETFEVDALRAESLLAALVVESRRDLAAALAEPHGHAAGRGVASAIAELRAALAALPTAGVNTDPFAHLRRLREAHAALETAVAAARDHAAHPVPSMTQVRRAIEAADRRLDVARDLVAAHPGCIGVEALTRLAESERLRIDLSHALGSSAAPTVAVTDPDDRSQMLAMAQRVASRASEALELARRDLDASRSPDRLRPRRLPSASQGDAALLS
ncbi:catechol 2,3-dioxygenase-like lactoylglutathione lyase family enzyme [Agromyces sp. 3263]|uniref:hypothetical protein n=1 Tax=Agromyces sp. 3263 TaxID=2817750 RepID=UPI002863BBE4|nr:hypothetical protein [Agromyces sp. 3263]MDR6906408.1 catechol 2,3-dioxygenase-like lactoylglutathione lyase family enzyme [Agromyces sp. 3263]